MSKMNTVPVVIQQTIESMLDDRTPDNVKFNNKMMLENITEVCDIALKKYEQQSDRMRSYK